MAKLSLDQSSPFDGKKISKISPFSQSSEISLESSVGRVKIPTPFLNSANSCVATPDVIEVFANNGAVVVPKSIDVENAAGLSKYLKSKSIECEIFISLSSDSQIRLVPDYVSAGLTNFIVECRAWRSGSGAIQKVSEIFTRSNGMANIIVGDFFAASQVEQFEKHHGRMVSGYKMSYIDSSLFHLDVSDEISKAKLAIGNKTLAFEGGMFKESDAVMALASGADVVMLRDALASCEEVGSKITDPSGRNYNLYFSGPSYAELSESVTALVDDKVPNVLESHISLLVEAMADSGCKNIKEFNSLGTK